MKNNKGLNLSLAIAYTYVGTVVGAGFASGQEIMAFFTVYGPSAFIGILISMAMFIIVSTRILLLGARLESPSFGEIIDRAFGLFAPLIKVYLLFALLIINGAMLAGAGTLFMGGEGIAYTMGITLTAIIAVITLAFGIKGILSINRIIVLSIFIFQIVIFLITLINGQSSYSHFTMIEGDIGLYIRKGITYASMNIFLAIGVLTGLGQEFKNIKTLRRAGIIGGMILGMMLAMAHYCIAYHMPMIFEHELPMLYIISNLVAYPNFPLSHWASFFYSLVLWGGIFTTLIGNLYSMITYFESRFKIGKIKIGIILLIISGILSYLGFSKIVNNLYPILGVIGTIFIAVIFIALGGKDNI